MIPDDIPARKQLLLLLLFFLFPILWHPWWLAVISMVLYAGLAVLVLGRHRKLKSTSREAATRTNAGPVSQVDENAVCQTKERDIH